jgi:hypothetical protein
VVPLIAAIFLNKSEFAYIAFHLIVSSAFIGILNSSTIYLRNYYNKEPVIEVSHILLSYFFVAVCSKYIFFPNIHYQSIDLVIVYCGLLIKTDNNRKIAYLQNCKSLNTFLALRLIGLLSALAVSYFSMFFSLLLIFLFTSLQSQKIKGKIREKTKSLKDYKQLYLFMYSYLIANVPIYFSSYFVGNDIFADARMLQLIFSGGAFLLMPLEMITIKKNQLQFRNSFTTLRHGIMLPKYFIFLYFALGIILLQSATILIPWLEANLIIQILLLINWYAHMIITKTTIELKAKNETKQQYTASTVSALIGIVLIFAFVLQPNLPIQMTYAVYLTLLCCSTTLILLNWKRDD